MPRMLAPATTFAAVVVCVALLLVVNSADVENPYSAKKSDLKYIACSVCKLTASELYSQVDVQRSKLSKPLSEEAIQAIVEAVCDTNAEGGKWIKHLDLVEEGDALAIKRQTTAGVCESECRTIERSCKELVDESDVRIAETLWQGKLTAAKFQSRLCKKWSKSCTKEPPPLDPNRKAGGDNFKPDVAASPQQLSDFKKGKKPKIIDGFKVWTKDDL